MGSRSRKCHFIGAFTSIFGQAAQSSEECEGHGREEHRVRNEKVWVLGDEHSKMERMKSCAKKISNLVTLVLYQSRRTWFGVWFESELGGLTAPVFANTHAGTLIRF